MSRFAEEPPSVAWWRIVCVVCLSLVISAVRVAVPSAAKSDNVMLLKRAVVADYATLIQATYEDALAASRSLADSVDTFLAKPSAASLEQARQAWIDAR